MTYDYLPYAITEFYCIICAIIVLSQLNSSLGSEHEVKQLKNMIYAYFVVLLSDIVYALVEGGLLDMNPLAYAAVNAVSVFAITTGCYFWFRFVEDRLHPTYTFSKVYRYIINIPLAIILVLDIVSIFTGFLFYIDANGRYQDGDYFIIQGIANFVYAVVPTINSLYLAFRTRSKLRQSEYAIYAIYFLAPVTAAILSDTVPTVPVLALNIFVVILLLFLNLQNMQIYNDALTTLNNRRRLGMYLDERTSNASESNPVMLFMLDINMFKSINDRYGHIEGDNALRLFANALKLAANKFDAFIARYGGDEFCFVMDATKGTPEEVESSIIDAIRVIKANSDEHPPYLLSASIGYATRSEPGFSVDSFIEEADNMLYENKRRWHSENANGNRAAA